MGPFCSKNIIFQLENFRGIVPGHWMLMQLLKEKWHMAWKITQGIWLIFMKAVESLKICTLIRSFCPKHIKFRRKNTEELCFLALESDAKLKEKLTLGSKNDTRNLVNFHPTTQKSKNFTLMGYFCLNIWGLSQKNTEELSFLTLKWCKMA